MLILLCISNFVILPFFSGFTIITVLSKIFWFFLLVAGITSLAKSRKQMWRFAMIPGMFVLVNTTELIFSNRLLEFMDFFINLSVFALLIGLVLVKVFEDGPVTFHRVVGAIVVFMLIGNVWSLMYSFLFIQFPGSISFPQAIVDKGITQDVFLYFSYTTLTTTGYGDMLPVHPATRTAAMIEQLIGVLYLAIFIGRLVSLVSDNRNKNKTPA